MFCRVCIVGQPTGICRETVCGHRVLNHVLPNLNVPGILQYQGVSGQAVPRYNRVMQPLPIRSLSICLKQHVMFKASLGVLKSPILEVLRGPKFFSRKCIVSRGHG